MARLVRTQSLDLAALRQGVSDWFALKRQSNLLAEKLDQGTKNLKGILQKYGEKDPSDGSLYLDLGDPIGEERIAWMKNLMVSSKRMNE